MIAQTEKILAYMKGGGTLTQLEALDLFGCMRLGARVLDLKKRGYRIEGTMELHRNAAGEYKHYKRYRLVA